MSDNFHELSTSIALESVAFSETNGLGRELLNVPELEAKPASRGLRHSWPRAESAGFILA